MGDSVEANRELVRRQFEELCNQKRGAAEAHRFWAADVEIHNKPMPDAPTGLAAVKAHMNALFTSFPDWHFEIHDLIAEGDKVVAHLTMTGTYQVAGWHLNNVAAVGQPVRREQINIFTIRDGRIVEMRTVADQMGMQRMAEAGLAPAVTA